MDGEIFAWLCQILPGEIVAMIDNKICEMYRRESAERVHKMIFGNVVFAYGDVHVFGSVWISSIDYCSICGEKLYSRPFNCIWRTTRDCKIKRCKCRLRKS
nr:hypothetical protein K-LCC10_0221 [Kaumoebavirus]